MPHPQSIHFIGIGGIGMSGLAAMYRDLGHRVSGSDRGADAPENAHIIKPLRARGIAIYPQDGSFIRRERPDVIVYSSAIETDNPDFAAAPGIPRLHRSEALQLAIEESHFGTVIAVSGSCGKSTVCAFLAETLLHLEHDVDCLDGAVIKAFASPQNVGNYRRGDGSILVFEADESDKSLRAYAPDYSVILNLGTDHYQKSELAEVFAGMLNRTRRGAVVSQEVYEAVAPLLDSGIEILVFADALIPHCDTPAVTDYLNKNATFSNRYCLELPQPGFHSALNALATFTTCRMLGHKCDKILTALQRFSGVKRRFDLHGTLNCAPVYDDYAHNPEKILSCIRAGREVAPNGDRYYIFQPHGYKPLGFMRDTLCSMLKNELQNNEHFFMLPVYYSGGSSSFTPTSEAVLADLAALAPSGECRCFPDRESLAEVLRTSVKAADAVVVMGARDNSLGDFAESLVNRK